MRCLDTIAKYLFYMFLIDFTLEMLDLVHRTYESDESFRSLDFMVHTRLWCSQVILQIFLGTLVPLAAAGGQPIWNIRRRAASRMYMTGRSADAHRNFCHALERGDRRATVLQEFSRIHNLQGGLRDAGRTAAGNAC